MAKGFISVFQLDGVPILPPVINDEVRAAVAIYRQKAIDIERRIEERKNRSAIQDIAVQCNGTKQDDPRMNVDEVGSECYPLDNKQLSNNTTVSNNTTIENDELIDSPVKLKEELSRTLTPTTLECADVGSLSPLPESIPIKPKETDALPMAAACLLDSTTSKTDLPPWQTSTRTVTPTSDESLPWLPLVRSNTYNLEKPTVDLQSLAEVPKHRSTPVDRALSSSALGSVSKQVTPKASTPSNKKPSVGNVVKKMTRQVTSVKLVRKATEPVIEKARTPRKSSSHTIDSCAAIEPVVVSATDALTAHEQRMKELLARQEEERLQLERSFREKTQELVALCAQTFTSKEDPGANVPATRTPELIPASSVSQLSLCDVSYDSCTDTDDAAYQTCHANGTSEENVADGESVLNNSLAKPIERGEKATPLDLNVTRTVNDINGNEQFVLLPQRIGQLQRHQAATIINAYARGHLTRRLLRTDEVQTIKRTIVDIICFIVQSRHSQQIGSSDASVRRSAGKHIAFCLDRLHDIFINYSAAQRMQMIRRDRYLKSKTTTPTQSQE